MRLVVFFFCFFVGMILPVALGGCTTKDPPAEDQLLPAPSIAAAEPSFTASPPPVVPPRSLRPETNELPRYAPVYPQATDVELSWFYPAPKRDRVLRMTSTDAQAKVIAFYKAALTTNGVELWTDKATDLEGVAPNMFVTVQVRSDDKAQKITITLGEQTDAQLAARRATRAKR